MTEVYVIMYVSNWNRFVSTGYLELLTAMENGGLHFYLTCE